MSIEKKVRECDFFLDEMRKHEGRAFGDREPFDFLLSAFLSAARTVDYRLRHLNKGGYSVWRAAWDESLSPHEAQLIKVLIDDRNLEVHEGGSNRIKRSENVHVSNFYSDTSGSLFVSGTPNMTGVVLERPTYFFEIGSTTHRATDACAEYRSLLKRMIADFGKHTSSKP